MRVGLSLLPQPVLNRWQTSYKLYGKERNRLTKTSTTAGKNKHIEKFRNKNVKIVCYFDIKSLYLQML